MMPYQRGDLPIRLFRFEQIAVGQQAEFVHKLTERDIEAFASLTGDFNPLHVDEVFARRTMFRKPVAHGMLSAAFVSTLIGTLLPGGGALWVSQKLDFHNPARVGDVLNIKAKVKRKSEASRTLTLEVEVTNQDNKSLISGESVVKVLEMAEEKTTMQNGDVGLTVLVTGGSRGIGAAIAGRLAMDGHAVAVNYRQSADEADRVVQAIVESGRKAIAVRGDVSEEKDVEGIFSSTQNAFGDVQAVVHCAGSGSLLRPFDQLSWTDFDRQLGVHVKGAFQCAKAALPKMIAAQRGAFVFIGSVAVDGIPPIQQADYVVAKSALTALARSLAAEYGPRGIRANTIAPGMTVTDMIANLPEKAKLLTRMQTPLRQLAEPADIAATASFLLSPGAQHISGETVRVCGGAVML
jgi:3-oxoacyl-[acyl-carrier protein] reductase